ncbi:hypothetical protein ANN_09493 [Periplaneta americana]|uniref:Uncharacterized protein n=1 Tax=Periplaneta americana TaxID=6978 RepID=A0ABQ8TMZ5_PERAM|nr:hypothetical protein ANN_09493 [Periplaneta americana]
MCSDTLVLCPALKCDVSSATVCHLSCFTSLPSLQRPTSVMRGGCPTPVCLDVVSPWFRLLLKTLTTALLEHPTSHAVSEMLVLSLCAITICPRSNADRSRALHILHTDSMLTDTTCTVRMSD